MDEENDEWFELPDASELGLPHRRLRLLADTHVPIALVEECRHGGLDIRTVQEEGVATLADPELFRYAKRLGRVLLTMDSQFWSERLYPVLQSGGIIVLDAGPQDAEKALDAFVLAYVAFARAYGNYLTDGMRVKAAKDRFRIRLRSHEGRNVTYVVRVNRRRVQVRELDPASE